MVVFELILILNLALFFEVVWVVVKIGSSLNQNTVGKFTLSKSKQRSMINSSDKRHSLIFATFFREELNKLMEAKGIAKKQPKEGSPVHDEP